MVVLPAERAESTIRRLVGREAAKCGCVKAVMVDRREDALDVLFVVDGDLFAGERAVLPLMRRLREELPDTAFDVMVMPSSRLSQGFRWGRAPRTLFERSS